MQAISLTSEQLDHIPPALAQAEVVLVMPCTDSAQARQAGRLMVGRAGVENAALLLVQDVHQAGFVALANRCFAATQSRYFGYVAQDAFAGRLWLKLALDALQKHDKALFGFNDGKWGGLLASFGLGRRDWLQANYGGPLFDPGYHQHYADTELTVLAMGNHQYCRDPQAVLVEVDWEKDHTPANPLDKKRFAERKQSWLPQHISHTASLEIFN